MNAKTKIVISVTLVIAMIVPATFVGAKDNEKEQSLDLESPFIGKWQFDARFYNPYGEDTFFFYKFKEDGTYSLYGVIWGQNTSIVGKWYVDEETKQLSLLIVESNDTIDISYKFSKDEKTLTLNPQIKKATRFNKIVIGTTEPIDDTDSNSTVNQPIPSAQEEPLPNEVIFMEAGKTFHVGSVSGICTVATQEVFYRCMCGSLMLYIDGNLHDTINIAEYSYEDVYNNHLGFVFNQWDTTKYENGLHQLQLVGSNDDILVEMLVIVQN